MKDEDQQERLISLTDMFFNFYSYANKGDTFPVNYLETESNKYPRTLSRFEVLRKIKAMSLGARPSTVRSGTSSTKSAIHKPDISLGYMQMLLTYLKLPFKSVFTENDGVKINFDKVLFNEIFLSDNEKEEEKLISSQDPAISSNKEISDDISDRFARVLRTSKDFANCIDILPNSHVRDGLSAFVFSDMDWRPTFIEALDLITEPFATYDPSTWSTFFIIKRMTIEEMKYHADKKTKFWNPKALEWAIENAELNRGIINRYHDSYFRHNYVNSLSLEEESSFCGENFSVTSFLNEKGRRIDGGDAGYLFVVEGYYTNDDGKIDKVIFFPSDDMLSKNSTEKDIKDERADVLFFRKDVFDEMKDAISIIPINRDEPSLERQRGFAFDLYPIVESLMHVDTAILDLSLKMGKSFFKDLTSQQVGGADATDLQDVEVGFNDDFVDIGTKEFVVTPFVSDLNAMLAVRSTLLAQARDKAFLGGLDGMEEFSNGRGANLANLRLVRDGRVFKHYVEDFAKGLKEFYTNIFRKILKKKDGVRLGWDKDDVAVSKLFYAYITKVLGYDESLFEFSKDDIIPDTGLPYWIDLEVVRNGASHFGAAEMVLYSEIKQVFGDGLDQKSLQALNRMGIKSLLGSADAIDILGNPKDNIVSDKDQVYRAQVETVTLLGSVDDGTLVFEIIPILEDKDDHVVHLRDVHNLKANDIIKRLQENEVTPAMLAEVDEKVIETRNDLILKLGAIANHISLHAQQLERFGSKRPDINQLKEESNAIMQTAEGLMNSLEINLRALQTKREETRMRLMNISPENEAEKMKQQTEMMKLQAASRRDEGSLAIANKLAEYKQKQHIDKQVSKAKDRELKKLQLDRQTQLELIKLRQEGKKNGKSRSSQK